MKLKHDKLATVHVLWRKFLDSDSLSSSWTLVLITSKGFVIIIDNIDALKLDNILQISVCSRY